jgi:hypothetical protein
MMGDWTIYTFSDLIPLWGMNFRFGGWPPHS